MKKKYLFFLLFLSFAAGSYANDTLTRAEIYSFNQGDTFEYHYSSQDIDIGMPLTTSYGRKVVMQKIFSANLDTIYFGYGAPGESISQWETITDLDSFPILQIPILDTTCAMLYSFPTTYAGYASNGLQISCFESGISYRYTKGLGCTLSGSGHVGNIGYGTVASSVELSYYSNGTTHVGTPYIPPPLFPIHYIPLPETCAVWTRTIYGSYSGFSPYGTITEQIHTGNQIRKGGKTYVELICRIQNDITHQFTPDSLIGYFCNNSPNLSAWFVTDTNGTARSLCSFTGQPGQQCSQNGYFSLDSVLIGGVYATRWTCSGNDDCNDAKISGIGNLSGLIQINHLYNIPDHETCGDLTCFCICGQKLYSNNTASTCDLLSGIPQLETLNGQFTIFPNPATDQLFIETHGMTVSEINLYNSIGVLVSQSGQQTNDIDISKLTNGLYIAEIKSKDVSVRKKWTKF
jgi:hypothetical protein